MHVEDERVTCLHKLPFLHDSLNSSQPMNNEFPNFLQRIGEMKTNWGWEEPGGKLLNQEFTFLHSKCMENVPWPSVPNRCCIIWKTAAWCLFIPFDKCKCCYSDNGTEYFFLRLLVTLRKPPLRSSCVSSMCNPISFHTIPLKTCFACHRLCLLPTSK